MIKTTTRTIGIFKVMIYDKIQSVLNKTKDKVLQSGFLNVITQCAQNDSIASILKDHPQVIITDHRLVDGLDALTFVEAVRQFSSIPIIIWGNRMPDKTENDILAFKKVYTLRSKDGLFSLTDILERMNQMNRNPQQWS
ncbi:MAG: hypothetical protein ABI763_04070 [Bacteroidota bacterium]